MRKVDPVRHEEKRQEILEAAKRCFARDGFRGASTAEICAEAGISPGHLYHYFPSKEAIVDALAEAALDEATTRFAGLMKSGNTVAALLSEIERGTARRVRSRPAVFLELLAEAGRNPAMAKVLQTHSRRMRDLLGDLLRQGQSRGEVDPGLDPVLAASVLIAIIDGSKSLTIRDPKLDMTKSVDLIKTMIARFLAPPGSRTP